MPEPAMSSAPPHVRLLQCGIGVPEIGEVGRAGLRVQVSQKRVVARIAAQGCDTAESWPCRSPKAIARVGQACWQAVLTSPSPSARSSRSAVCRARG